MAAGLESKDEGCIRPKLRVVIVGALWFVSGLTTIGQWFLLWVAVGPGLLAGQVLPADLVSPLVILLLASFGAVVVLRGRDRRYGWLMVAIGVTTGVVGFAGHYSLYALEADVPVQPAAIWIQDLWMIPQMLGYLLLPALFPEGRAASARWSVLVRTAIGAWVALIVVFVLTERPASNFFEGVVDGVPVNATGFLRLPEHVINIWWVALAMGSIMISIGSLVTRWRHADVELRQRLKWLIYIVGVFSGLLALDLVAQVVVSSGADPAIRWFVSLLTSVGMVAMAVGFGLAVLRSRLYDVDLVINRTAVYGLLTIGVMGIYVGVVVGVGALLPVGQTLLAMILTGLVAVIFAPLRDWLQGWVNRMMFGQRDDPYSVLSEMGRVMAETGSPEDTLQTLAETVAASLKLPGAAIELKQDGEWAIRASAGESATAASTSVTVPLRYQGEIVGRLVVMPRSATEPLSAQDRALLDDIANPAGAIAKSVSLTMALQSSRERLVLAREEERRRIRRDLHDGLGPSLASQTFQLDEIMDRLNNDRAGAGDLVTALKKQNRQLVAEIRRLVYELRPPALDDLGIAGALGAHVAQLERSASISIEIHTVPDPLPAVPAAIEVAAYRIVREAITNTVRHASARRCIATIEASDGGLIIDVRDDGVGLAEGTQVGVGLTSMRERTEELGGTFSIAPGSPRGARVLATLPLTNGSTSQPSTMAAHAAIRNE